MQRNVPTQKRICVVSRFIPYDRYNRAIFVLRFVRLNVGDSCLAWIAPHPSLSLEIVVHVGPLADEPVPEAVQEVGRDEERAPPKVLLYVNPFVLK